MLDKWKETVVFNINSNFVLLTRANCIKCKVVFIALQVEFSIFLYTIDFISHLLHDKSANMDSCFSNGDCWRGSEGNLNNKCEMFRTIVGIYSKVIKVETPLQIIH